MIEAREHMNTVSDNLYTFEEARHVARHLHERGYEEIHIMKSWGGWEVIARWPSSTEEEPIFMRAARKNSRYNSLIFSCGLGWFVEPNLVG